MDNQNNNETSKVEKPPVRTKPLRDKVANGSLICMGILFLQSIFFTLFKWEPYCNTMGLPVIIFLTAVLVGMAGFFIRKKRDTINKLLRFCLIITTLILGIIILESFAYEAKTLGRAVVCGSQLRGIHAVTTLYSQDNEGRLPEAGKWGKAIMGRDMIYKMFFCPVAYEQATRAEISLSSYAMNVEAGGKKLSELPEDMVLFFCAEIEESKAQQFKQEKSEEILEFASNSDGGNKKMLALYGGPELLSFRHKNYSNTPIARCIFVNGKTPKLNPVELRWYIDPDKQQKARDNMQRHLAQLKKKQLTIKCGVLIAPYVLWLVIFLALKTTVSKRRTTGQING